MQDPVDIFWVSSRNQRFALILIYAPITVRRGSGYRGGRAYIRVKQFVPDLRGQAQTVYSRQKLHTGGAVRHRRKRDGAVVLAATSGTALSRILRAGGSRSSRGGGLTIWHIPRHNHTGRA